MGRAAAGPAPLAVKFVGMAARGSRCGTARATHAAGVHVVEAGLVSCGGGNFRTAPQATTLGNAGGMRSRDRVAPSQARCVWAGRQVSCANSNRLAWGEAS